MTMFNKTQFVTLIVLLFSVASASANALQDELQRAIQTELEQSGAPSLQVAIGYKGEILFGGAFGLADLESSVPATMETRYRSASISKWLTATAGMQLAEQGKLDLLISRWTETDS